MAENRDGRIDIVFAADDRQLKTAIRQNSRDVQAMARNFEQEGGKIDATLKRMGAAVAGFFTIQQASGMVRQIAAVRGEFQQLEVAFGTMLQSEERATALMSQLVNTAATTPFELQDVAGAAKQLLAYGFAAEEVNQTLIDLGNIAAGLSIPLGDLVYLYGTTMTQGRVYTMDMRQFMGRGIPLAEELAKQFGVTKNEVNAMVTAGKVGFADVEKAIKSMSGEGGKFYNLMEKQSKTITGQISNIQDAFSMMLNDIGKQSEGLINGALSSLSWLIENYEKIGKVLAGIAATYGVYKASVMAAVAIQNIAMASTKGWTVAELAHFKALTIVEKAQKLLNKTMLANPYVLITAAVVGLGAAMIKLATHTTAAEKAQKELQKAKASVDSGAYDSQYRKESAELKTLAERLNSAEKGTIAWNTARDELLSKYGSYDAALSSEIEKTGKVADSIARINAALTKQAKLRGYSNFVSSQEEALQASIDKTVKDVTDYFSKKESRAPLGYTQGSAISSIIDYIYGGSQHLNSLLKSALDSNFKTSSSSVEAAREAVKKMQTLKDDALKVFGLTEADVKTNAGTTSGGRTNEPLNNDKEIKERKAALKARLEMEREVANQRVALYNQGEQGYIDAMEEGLDRELRQLQLNHKKQKEELQKQEQETLKMLQEQEKAQWQAKNPGKDADVKFTTSIKELPQEWRDLYDAIYKAMAESQRQAYNVALSDFWQQSNDLVSEGEQAYANAMIAYAKAYGTIAEKRAAIVREYEDKMIAAGGGEAGDKMREYLRRQMEDALATFDMANDSSYKMIFGDPSKMTSAAISKAIDTAKLKLKELNKDANPESWKVLIEAIDKLENARADEFTAGWGSNINKVLGDALKLSMQMDALEQSFKDGLIDQSDYEVSKAMLDKQQADLKKSIAATGANAFANSLGTAANYMAQIAEISDDIDLSQTAQEMSDVAEAWSSIASGAANGGWVGAMVSLLTSLINFYVKAFTAPKMANEKALASLKEYREQVANTFTGNDFKSIFGNDELRSAVANIKELTAAQKAYDASIKTAQTDLMKIVGYSINLKDASVQWGSAKKGRKSTLGELYPEIFDENGELILDKAHLALDNYAGDVTNEAYDNRGYELLKQAIEAAEKLKDVSSEVDSYLSGIFGSLGDTIADAILSGADAFATLDDSAADFVNSFTKDIIKSMILTDEFTQVYKDKIMAAIASGNQADLVNAVKEMTDAVAEKIDAAQGVVDQIDAAAGAAGIDTAGARQASSSGIAQASQDSIDELNGRFTAIQGHTSSIRDNVAQMSNRSSQILSHVMGIHDNTSSMEMQLRSLARDVATIKNTL